MSKAPSETLVAIGTRLRRWRVHRGMFQGALAKAAGMGQTAVSNYEHGEREMSVTIMQRLAKALGISDEELLNADPPDSEGDTP